MDTVQASKSIRASHGQFLSLDVGEDIKNSLCGLELVAQQIFDHFLTTLPEHLAKDYVTFYLRHLARNFRPNRTDLYQQYGTIKEIGTPWDNWLEIPESAEIRFAKSSLFTDKSPVTTQEQNSVVPVVPTEPAIEVLPPEPEVEEKSLVIPSVETPMVSVVIETPTKEIVFTLTPDISDWWINKTFSKKAPGRRVMYKVDAVSLDANKICLVKQTAKRDRVVVNPSELLQAPWFLVES